MWGTICSIEVTLQCAELIKYVHQLNEGEQSIFYPKRKKKIFNILSSHTFFRRTRKRGQSSSAQHQPRCTVYSLSAPPGSFQSFWNITKQSPSVSCDSKNHLVLQSDSKSMLIYLHHTFGGKDQTSLDTSTFEEWLKISRLGSLFFFFFPSYFTLLMLLILCSMYSVLFRLIS